MIIQIIFIFYAFSFRLFKKGKITKSNRLNVLYKKSPSQVNSLKTNTLLKEVSLSLWKKYITKRKISKRKNGEASRKELKESLKCNVGGHRKKHKKENNGRTESEDDADGEKSGNEDSSLKLKKKVFKKRKFSDSVYSGEP